MVFWCIGSFLRNMIADYRCREAPPVSKVSYVTRTEWNFGLFEVCFAINAQLYASYLRKKSESRSTWTDADQILRATPQGPAAAPPASTSPSPERGLLQPAPPVAVRHPHGSTAAGPCTGYPGG
jgi:hypothetical protein